MPEEPKVLLYNFTDSERHRRIQRYLAKSGVSVRRVQTPEFLHPIGYLFEMQGFFPCPQFNLGGNFQEEMLIMKDFSSERMDRFLEFFREQKLEPLNLKAVLTPVTQHWNSLKLHEELMRERQALEKNPRRQ